MPPHAGAWSSDLDSPYVAGFLPLAPRLPPPELRGFFYLEHGMRSPQHDLLGWIITLALCTVIVSFLLLAFDLTS
jgi:hypothetical protein